MGRSPVVAIAVLWAVASAAAQPASSPPIAGVVALVAGPMVLVRTAEGPLPVLLPEDAVLTGVSSAASIRPGDDVVIELAGVQRNVPAAERLAVRARPTLQGDRFLPVAAVDSLLGPGASAPAIVIDCRGEAAFGAGHIPGALHVGSAGAALSLGKAPGGLILVGADAYDDAPFRHFARHRRERMGPCRVLQGGVEAWSRSGRTLEVEPGHLAPMAGQPWALLVVDVREEAEYRKGHIPGAFHVALDGMDSRDFARMGGMPPMVFYGEGRDPRARDASERALRWRYQNATVLDGPVGFLSGGFGAWKAAGRAVEEGPGPGPYSLDRVAGPGEVLPSELPGLLAAGARGPLLVDLRKTEEAGPAQALHLSLEDLLQRMDELPKERELVLFCTMGIRSRIGYEILKRNGYRVRYLREAPEF